MRPMSESGFGSPMPSASMRLAVVAAGEHAQRAGLHGAELAGVDEQRLALAVAAAVLEVLARSCRG